MTYTTSTADPVVSAVSTADLAEWLVVDAADPILPMVSVMATGMAIEFMERELLNRARVVTYEHWPYIGTFTRPSLSRQAVELENVITLPYAGLQSVTSVTAYGTAVTDYRELATKPASLLIDPRYRSNEDEPALVIEYTAGYGTTTADVPEPIRLGVMALAAVLYEHRGACDAKNAMHFSGAAAHLQPYRLRTAAL